MKIDEKIDKYLKEESSDDYDLEDNYDEELFDKMLDLIFSLDETQVTEEQADIILEIVELLDDGSDDDIDDDIEYDEEYDGSEVDEVFKIRKRRDLTVKRKRRRAYRRKKATRKLKARKYRRSARGKMTMRKAKRKAKVGRTSTNKRQRKFIGPDLGKR